MGWGFPYFLWFKATSLRPVFQFFNQGFLTLFVTKLSEQNRINAYIWSMKELGLISKLPINRFTDFGAYLALSSGEELLLPKGYLLGEEKEGDIVEVFIYTDSEDRPVAVTQNPWPFWMNLLCWRQKK